MAKLFLIAGVTASISAALGITDERQKEILNGVENIIKEENEKPDGNRAETVVRVWNQFEANPAECAYAMFVVEPTEEKVQMHAMFSGMLAPEAVGEENN